VVQDVDKISGMNWNKFTLRFLKDNIATMKQGTDPNRCPLGNLTVFADNVQALSLYYVMHTEGLIHTKFCAAHILGKDPTMGE
jgi:hypothetical protein